MGLWPIRGRKTVRGGPYQVVRVTKQKEEKISCQVSSIFVRGQNPFRHYESEDDQNATLLQTYFGVTLPLKAGYGTKDKKEKANKYM